jgi:hypothetical protein
MIPVILCLGFMVAEDTNYPATPVEDISVLSDKGKKILERIENSPSTVDGKVYIVKFDGNKVGKKIMIQVGSKKVYGPFYFDNCEVKDSTSITGRSTRVTSTTKNGSLSLHIMGKYVSGMVHWDQKVYSLESLGDGYIAIVQIDQTKIKDHP